MQRVFGFQVAELPRSEIAGHSILRISANAIQTRGNLNTWEWLTYIEVAPVKTSSIIESD
jgi:hypothetical protein